MATQYTPILQLALPVTGELNGTWGDVVNDNITSMVEQAIAGLATINTWTTNSHTLTTADGTTDEARCAMLVAADGAGGTALTGAGQIICPARTKLYVLKNSSSYAITLKTSAGTGVAVPVSDTAFLFCDGTNVGACVTTIVNGHIAGNLTVDGNTILGNATSDTITANARIASDLNPSADNTYDLGTVGNSWRNLYVDGIATIATLNVTTIDTTNLEVTNIKAKDGTAAITLADSTGVATFSATPVLNAGTINQVQFLNASKQLVGDADFTFDGTTLSVAGLTLTNSPTLNGGTANQVQFLNASKVLSGDADLTFDGTTLTAANFTSGGTVTLSGGTANSVPYLNGSKVLTTGSALTFNGILSSPKYVATSAGNDRILIEPLAAGSGTLLVGTNNAGSAYAPLVLDGGGIRFNSSGSEQMRLTSTGLGIGTSSPATKLHVAGATRVQDSSNSANYMTFGVGANAPYGNASISTTTAGLAIVAEGAGSMAFLNNGSERMRIDSSGNVGIGTSSPSNRLHVSTAGPGALVLETTAASSDQTQITFKGTTGNKWAVGNNAATGGTGANFDFYDLAAGANRMRIDSSGNLGLGVTPSAWVSYKGFQVQDASFASSNSADTQITANAYAGSGGWTYIKSAASSRYVMDNQHRWYTAPSGTAGNAISFTQAMTLAASGGLSIGTTNDAGTGNVLVGNGRICVSAGSGSNYSARLSCVYNYPYVDTYLDSAAGPSYSGQIIFRANSDNGAMTERMRIDSNGNLLVGTTSTDPRNFTSGSGYKLGDSFEFANSSTVNVINRTSSGSGTFVGFRVQANGTGSITTDGTSTAYNTSSDYRLKKNIQPMQNALATVAQLNPVTYTWKADGSDGQGFIAHELQAVVPDCVTGEKDAVDAEGNPVYQGIDTSFLVATLTKAIQEQQELINQLTARVAQLEGK